MLETKEIQYHISINIRINCRTNECETNTATKCQ